MVWPTSALLDRVLMLSPLFPLFWSLLETFWCSNNLPDKLYLRMFAHVYCSFYLECFPLGNCVAPFITSCQSLSTNITSGKTPSLIINIEITLLSCSTPCPALFFITMHLSAFVYRYRCHQKASSRRIRNVPCSLLYPNA